MRTLPLLLAGVWAASGLPAPASPAVAIRGARVFTGTDVYPSATVVIRDGRIAAVGRRTTAPYDAREVVGAGMTLLPAMIFACNRIDSVGLEKAAVQGIGTVVDLAVPEGSPASSEGRAAFDRPRAAFRSPELVLDVNDAPAAVDRLHHASGGHGRFVVVRLSSGEADSSATLADSVAVSTLVRSAHRRGLQMVARADGHLAQVAALEGGIDAVAGGFQDESGGPWLWQHFTTHRDALAIPRLAEVAGGPARDSAMALVGRIHRLGTTVLPGASCSSERDPGEEIRDELRLMVLAGLTPTEALESATAGFARRFDLAERGRIAFGMRADLVLVRGDPTRDITALNRIEHVWLSGIELQPSP